MMPKKSLMLVIVGYLLFSPVVTHARDWDKANELYRAERYAEAAELYTKEIASGAYKDKNLANLYLARGFARDRSVPIKIYGLDRMSIDELQVIMYAREDFLAAMRKTEYGSEVYQGAEQELINTNDRIRAGEDDIASRDPEYKKELDQKRINEMDELKKLISN